MTPFKFCVGLASLLVGIGPACADGPAFRVVPDGSEADAPHNPFGLTDVGGIVYFAADSAGHGRELWHSDGTAAGTAMVVDLTPGDGGSDIDSLTDWNGTVAFLAGPTPDGAVRIWRSDGTAIGTVALDALVPGHDWLYPGALTVDGERLLFGTVDGTAWRTDGTPAGTVELQSPRSDAFLHRRVTRIVPTDRFDLLVFNTPTECCNTFQIARADTDVYMPLLFVSSRPGDYELEPREVALIDQDVLFAADGRLYRTDGTSASLIQDRFGGDDGQVYLRELTSFADGACFAVGSPAGGALWCSDGTETGTRRVKTFDYWPQQLTALGQTLLFVVFDAQDRWELWRSDGSEAGTIRLRAFDPPTNGTLVENLVAIDETAVFTTRGSGYTDLWVTDGSSERTAVIQRLPGQFPGPFIASGAYVFFTLLTPAEVGELWAVPRAALRATRPVPCTGDCDADGRVGIDELLQGVAIALGATDCAQCATAFCQADCGGGPAACHQVGIDCLVRAVRAALDGCPTAACEVDADCDDGNDCSVDQCTPDGCTNACACV